MVRICLTMVNVPHELKTKYILLLLDEEFYICQLDQVQVNYILTDFLPAGYVCNTVVLKFLSVIVYMSICP